MENWQFLIQKQGDRSWYNLQFPNLEISEGIYRVLARSHLGNTEVEIRVTHSSTQQIPSKRLIHKQSRRTDAQGLISVIPFTYLKPGTWQFQCSADLMSDLLGKSWQYSIYIEVLFQQSTGVWSPSPTDENRGSNLPPFHPTTTSIISLSDLGIPIAMDNAVISQPVSPALLQGETAQQRVENFMAVGLNSTETVSDDHRVEDTLSIKPSLPLSLSLDRETYIAPWGETAVIRGRVELQDQINWEGEKAPERLYALELLIELRSPTGSDIFTQVWQPLPDSTLPIKISSAICIPVDCQSQLILADIHLYGALTKLGEVVLLANQSFKITADITEVLATFPQQNLLNHPIDEELAQQNKTRDPINCKQLGIKDHGVLLNSTFPYLKRLEVLPDKTDVAAEDFQQMDRTVSENQKTPELLRAREELQIVIPQDWTGNAHPSHYSSPLIRKWIESQGYPIPQLSPGVLALPKIADPQRGEFNSQLHLGSQSYIDQIPVSGNTGETLNTPSPEKIENIKTVNQLPRIVLKILRI
ncbi:hypothetical protein NWP22_17225 [Anabaenopsis tanganyikae CS-531]|uniref:Uncharacterized protein n=2 Tax=Anabaenopsis TaxID=110103 RepID=A0ABT5AS31_9CYAN|nr:MULTISPECIES: hypothetical protein [Anabaenopsis]MDB9539241.1 hypothetical protein [Anabaenopsis arnoldii]MDH6091529.1 hypothetical protein [Anabaenopsis arnoldii]MDH6107577.1 hypothetical protein [Anabaenopsis tanganyikae CS-531]